MYSSSSAAPAKLFNAEIIAGPLLVTESRKIARLLLDNVDQTSWHQAIVGENLLQNKSIKLARRQAKLIRNRLSLMTPEHWHMVAEGTLETTTQALLAAAVKHSRLIGDFLLLVVKTHIQVFNNKLSVRDWERFLVDCEQLDPRITGWAETTRKKLGSIVFRMLTEAHYLDNIRSKRIIPVIMVEELRRYLTINNESYVLNCLDVSR